jgi:RNA polymerase sigma-70 factor (ECF subfamily)
VAEDRTDPELIERYLAGDAAAFSTLVRRHEKRVYNLCYRMLGREEDARDAAQDAFITALRKLSSFRGEAQFTTWLHRVTVNACYDVLRRKKREPMLEPPREEDAPEPPGPASPDHADSAVAAVDVQRALMRVPQEFRVVLVMHDVHDLGYDDIAESLGIPVGTVKSRLHRGRVALAEELGEGERGRGHRRPAEPASDDGAEGAPGPIDEGVPDRQEPPGEPSPSKERFPE